MPLVLTTFEDLVQIAQAELRRQIPSIDPTVPESWAEALTTSVAAAVFVISQEVKELEKQLFAVTATDDFLDRIGAYDNLPRNTATGASGLITVIGTDGTTVPISTTFSSVGQLLYDTIEIGTISDQTRSISSLTRVGTTVTAITPGAHNLSNDVPVTVINASPMAYNGTFDITVLDNARFTYQVAGSPASPATGAIEFTATYGSIEVRAQDVDVETNLARASVLTVIDTDVVVGMDNAAIVQADGLVGGSPVEGDESYRSRILLSRGLQEGVFTAEQVQLAALGLTGNTRVFVKRPTNLGVGTAIDPVPGQVSVFVLRDGDSNPVPPQNLLDDTKALVLSNGQQPAHTIADDIFVVAPVPVFTGFTFTAIDPNTPTMQAELRLQLAAFFQDEVRFEQTVTLNAYTCAIQATQDSVTGEILQSFTLSAPSGDIVITAGEIAFYDDTTTTFA